MTKFVKGMLNTVLGEALLPTGKNLPQALVICLVITGVNLLLTFLELPKLFSLGGCFGATLVLVVLIIIERSEYSAVSKMYSDVELCLKSAKSGYKAVSSSIKDVGVANTVNKFAGNVKRRPSAGHDGASEDDGLVIFCGPDSEECSGNNDPY